MESIEVTEASLARPAQFEFLGGRLCLDFVNTAAWEHGRPVRDRLSTFADVVAWAGASELISPRRTAELVRHATAQPAIAQQRLTRARALRATLHQLFSTAAHGAVAPDSAVASFNAFLGSVNATLALASDADGLRLRWNADPSGSDDLLAPVLWSATALLGCDVLQRVRECAGNSCGWFYLDESRNHSRRWCDMKVCGNREKARRHRQRKE